MLHGNIAVNNRIIGKWTAVNKGKPVWLRDRVQGDQIIYECSIEMESWRGGIEDRDFYILHTPSRGALALSTSVLENGETQLDWPKRSKAHAWQDFCAAHLINHYSLLD